MPPSSTTEDEGGRGSQRVPSEQPQLSVDPSSSDSDSSGSSDDGSSSSSSASSDDDDSASSSSDSMSTTSSESAAEEETPEVRQATASNVTESRDSNTARAPPPPPPAARGKRTRKRGKVVNPKRGRVDIPWETMTLGPSAQRSLLADSSAQELEDLVGWATHVTGPSGVNDNDDESNPLADLPNVPWRPSALHYISQQLKETLAAQDQPPMALDTSAMVTLGMALEEMVTANLLPLATAVVDQAQTAYARSAFAIAEDFRAYCQTLDQPAAQAILSIRRPAAEDGSDARVPPARTPLARPPSKYWRPHVDLNNDQETNQTRQEPSAALSRWCTVLGLDEDLVRQNEDVFGAFLGSTPSDASAV